MLVNYGSQTSYSLPVGKMVLRFGSHFEVNPAIQFLNVFAKELKFYIHTKTCMWIITAGLFVINSQAPETAKTVNR